MAGILTLFRRRARRAHRRAKALRPFRDSRSFRPTSFTDAASVQTSFIRNGFGEVIRETSPDRGTSTYSYDAAGSITSATDGRGQVVNYSYDILGRVLTKTPVGQPAAQVVTYSYDTGGIGSYQKGRLTKVADGASGANITLFEYDHLGRMITKRQTVGTSTAANLIYAYDKADRITQVTYPSGRLVQYLRDTKGRVITVQTKATAATTAWTSIASALQYEPFGALKQATLGNTLSMTVNWGNDGRLASRRLYKTVGGANRSLLTYAYDNDDNITSITDGVVAAANASYAYDSVGRLTRVDTPSRGIKRTDYLHDANGNRTSVQRRLQPGDATPAETDSYTRTAGTNRLASSTGTYESRSFTHDARGNLSAETRTALSSGSGTIITNITTAYDGYGRLTGYTRTFEPNLAHVYNGLDDRVQTTRGTTIRRFVYDMDGRALGEYGTSATDVKAEFIWMNPGVDDGGTFGGDDGVGGYAPLAVAANDNGNPTLSWVHGNHLGVPLVTTDASGTAMPMPTSYDLPGFPGQSKTLADLYYNRYRDYDTTTGRYTQADPIGLAGDENPYVYAGADPVNAVDPEGLETYWEHYTGLPDSTRVDIMNAIAGASDAATLNLTYYAREALGSNREIKTSSKTYQRSEYVGIALGTCFGGAAGWRAAGTKGYGKEFSHWLPKRSGGPRSKWNGNYVKIKTHALSDRYRHRFMPKDWKKVNPLPSKLQQQVVRAPRVYVGAAAGAAGSASTR